MHKLLVLGLIYSALGLAQRPTYTIAAQDHILIRVPQSAKLDGKVFEVDARGFVALPSIGRMRAAGLTLEGFEKELARRLKRTTPAQPQVSVSEVSYSH